ncbi:MAG: sialidase family protein, partial [Pseudomonadota bacterium]
GRFVTAPYGRPPQLLSVAGSAIEMRPWPEPGDEVGPGSIIPGFTGSAGALEQLSAGPGCEAGPWSFQRVASSPNHAFVIGVSSSRALSFKLPAGNENRIGCGTGAIVVEVFDEKKKEPQLIRCTLDGKCAEPKSFPFAIWPEEHERTILTAATDKGVVATMSARTGTRWGAYLATSVDGGKTFDLPRVIGEGQTDRGYFEIVALVNFTNRVLVLLSADVTGTRRRGWYVLASDDGGENWGLP